MGLFGDAMTTACVAGSAIAPSAFVGEVVIKQEITVIKLSGPIKCSTQPHPSKDARPYVGAALSLRARCLPLGIRLAIP